VGLNGIHSLCDVIQSSDVRSVWLSESLFRATTTFTVDF